MHLSLNLILSFYLFPFSLFASSFIVIDIKFVIRVVINFEEFRILLIHDSQDHHLFDCMFVSCLVIGNGIGFMSIYVVFGGYVCYVAGFFLVFNKDIVRFRCGVGEVTHPCAHFCRKISFFLAFAQFWGSCVILVDF